MEKFLNNKKEISEKHIEPLSEVYREIYDKNPDKMEEWQIAQSILEVLDNPEWVSEKIAKECLYKIVQVVRYPNDETRKK